MARLDRLGPAKEIAQVGATLGREFSYELLAAVSPLDEVTLQHGLKQLVEAELVYQRGLMPQAHYARGLPLWWLGKFAPALGQAEQGLALYATQPSSSWTFLYGRDPGVYHRALAANALWQLGYPTQAQQRMHEALTLAQALSEPFIFVYALNVSCVIASLRREGEAVQEWAEIVITLSTDHGFTFFLPWGVILQGWALAERGQGEERIAQIHQGLAAYQATGAELWQPYFRVLLADACRKIGRREEGLTTVAEALSMVNKNEERWCEAELYRLKGTLTLQSGASLGQVSGKSQASQNKSEVPSTRHPTPSTQAEAEAEACFLKAIEIARCQSAKSLELRAVMSLSRLWQSQGKKDEARQLLAQIYGWFTEGFDTKDLQEAKALIEELSH